MNGKLIAKNTLFLSFRMLVIMLITLYTSRVVLQVLGVQDFGIYNIVGGFVGLLAFFQSSLSNATQRYLNIALGEKNEDKANKIFNQSLILYIGLAFLLIILGTPIGLWFLNAKLNISENRLYAANVTFLLSLCIAVISIIQVTYSSLIIAKEKMTVYAYLSIVEVSLKLIMTISLMQIGSIDRLILYAIFMLLSSLVVFIFNYWYCKTKFSESLYFFVWDMKLIKEMLSFLSKNIYSCAVWMLSAQGYNIVLNLFFGTTVNAARGVAVQVENAVLRFTSNILTAARPQITMSYASGDLSSVMRIIKMSTKISAVLYLTLALPLFVFVDEVLSLWLTIVPDYTSEFVRLLLIDAFIGVIFSPLTAISMATGNIMRSLVYGKSLVVFMLPLAWFLYHYEIIKTPMLVFYLLIITDIIYLIYMIYDAFKQININVSGYLVHILIPILLASVICGSCGLWLQGSIGNGICNFCFVSCAMVLLLMIITLSIILTKSERTQIVMYLKKIKK